MYFHTVYIFIDIFFFTFTHLYSHIILHYDNIMKMHKSQNRSRHLCRIRAKCLSSRSIPKLQLKRKAFIPNSLYQIQSVRVCVSVFYMQSSSVYGQQLCHWSTTQTQLVHRNGGGVYQRHRSVGLPKLTTCSNMSGIRLSNLSVYLAGGRAGSGNQYFRPLTTNRKKYKQIMEKPKTLFFKNCLFCLIFSIYTLSNHNQQMGGACNGEKSQLN